MRRLAMGGVTWTIAALMACAGCAPQDPPDEPEDPSAASCAEHRTRQQCFDGGCSFFVSTFPLLDVEEGGRSDERQACTRGTPRSLCVLADALDGPDVLTWYQRTLDDGSKETTQLKVDVNLEGWTRCGYVDVPPDCACTGAPPEP
ncbi:MAG: hypothetical protein AAGI01_04540 [Myxococcota bacterium]